MQSSFIFFSTLEKAPSLNSKLFLAQSQVLDKSKIYLNVGYLTSLRSALILNIYAPLWAINIAMWFQYYEGIGKVLLRLNNDLPTAHVHKDPTQQYLFLEKNWKRNRKGKSKHMLFLWHHTIVKIMQGGRTQSFLVFLVSLVGSYLLCERTL